MKVEIDNLITVANYARKQKQSVQWIYKLIERHDLKHIIIDGVIFIITK